MTHGKTTIALEVNGEPVEVAFAPHKTLLEVLREAKQFDSTIPVLLMTAFGSVEEAVTAMKEGAFDFLQKPVDLEHLKLQMERAARQQELLRENLLLREEYSTRYGFPRIIGDYNPDWGVVRIEDGKVKLQLVRETKGTAELDKLQHSQEEPKVRCAERYFMALGIDYRVVDPNTVKWWLPSGVADEQLLS